MTTLKDIAEKTGFSLGTVSDILNERGGVKYGAATVSKVRETAGTLGYQKNRAASTLRLGKSRTIGVLVPDLADPFYSSILKRVMARLRGEGFGTLIEECIPGCGSETEREIILGLGAYRIDGLLALLPSVDLHDAYRPLCKQGVKVLAMGQGGSPGFDSLRIETRPGLRDLVSAARQFGHRRLLFVNGGGDDEPGRILREEWEKGAMDDDSMTEIRCESSPEAGREVLRSMINRYPDRPPSILVASSDSLAFGLARACKEIGLAIPSAVSVVSLGNTALAAHWPTALTSVGVAVEALADRCANRVLSRIRERAPAGPGSLVFEADLVLRESLGPAG